MRILLALISIVELGAIPGPRIKNGTRISVSYLALVTVYQKVKIEE